MTKTMSRRFLAAALLLLVGAPAARAEFQVGATQSDFYTSNTNFSYNHASDPAGAAHLTFTKFSDPAIVLTRAEVTVDLSVQIDALTIRPVPSNTMVTVDYKSANVVVSNPTGMDLGLGGTGLSGSILPFVQNWSDTVNPYFITAPIIIDPTTITGGTGGTVSFMTGSTSYAASAGTAHIHFVKEFTGAELAQFLADPSSSTFAIPFLANANFTFSSSTGNGHATVVTTGGVAATVSYFGVVPEPSSVALLALGASGLLLAARPRHRRAAR